MLRRTLNARGAPGKFDRVIQTKATDTAFSFRRQLYGHSCHFLFNVDLYRNLSLTVSRQSLVLKSC